MVDTGLILAAFTIFSMTLFWAGYNDVVVENFVK